MKKNKKNKEFTVTTLGNDLIYDDKLEHKSLFNKDAEQQKRFELLLTKEEQIRFTEEALKDANNKKNIALEGNHEIRR